MALVASGRDWRRREIVAALFSLLDGEEALATTGGSSVRDEITPDNLVSRLSREEGEVLVRLARLFTDDRNAAEDLGQEAFVRLHRSANRIKNVDKGRTVSAVDCPQSRQRPQPPGPHVPTPPGYGEDRQHWRGNKRVRCS